MPRDLDKPAGRSDIDAFLDQVKQTPSTGGGKRGRLIFAMDATASRQAQWDQALHIQSEMFQATEDLGGLDIQLIFYRGFGECRASKWYAEPAELRRAMLTVRCLGGRTQIGKVLSRAMKETRDRPVQAVVFVGDCMEEDADMLCDRAGQLGLLKTPLFMFHEGGEPLAADTFRQMAKLSGGAYCRFDAASADRLKELLRAVAVYAAGGRRALSDRSNGNREIAGLLEQLK
ncbi:VWA domain-containing protein [Minwuia sp.]|uniref:VWA domain-containing protein n=1 Tax=Minwuia sp. TaxID=2493630 RepID=UPI003A9565ED